VLLCLDERNGALHWQLVVPKLAGDRFLDWPRVGICSPATVEGDRVYIVTNRAEVLCLDLDGMADGNDGPFKDEAAYVVPDGADPIPPGKTDADILWRFDMPSQAGIWPHDSAHSSILLHGGHLYLNTGNGVDNTHRKIRRPDGPSLIVLDKATGRLVARDDERIGPRIFHATWSSPALARIGGEERIIFGGGDAVLYGFAPPTEGEETLKRVWRFDCDPTAPKENVHQYSRNRKVSPSMIKCMPVFHRGRVYLTVGGDIWWGKHEAWLQCVDATGTGDVTESALLWACPLERHACSTPAIHNGLVFVGDLGRNVHCIDARTGKPLWRHKTNGEIWGSTLVADGKVYVGTRGRDFYVFAAAREKKVLGSVKLKAPMTTTPTAANGVLFVATTSRLYALHRD
jgi:outer membrane protein assembly factor BamB